MPETTSGTGKTTTQLILWPAVITLVITIIRLVGELQGWPKPWFDASAGGGAAIVGISWLPIIFGPYFAWKLAVAGKGPASIGKAFVWVIIGFLVIAVGIWLLYVGARRTSMVITLLGSVVLLVAAFVPGIGWCALGNTLLAYAFAARIPVLIVMLIAMKAGWHTHYSAITTSLAGAPFWRQFLELAFLPQMFFWIGYTVIVGALLGTGFGVVGRRSKEPAPAAS